MPATMQAAAVERFGAPLVLREWLVPVPAADQIVVRTEACGVCGTGVHAAAVGADVTAVREGERVAVPWLYAACGHCGHRLSAWETVCANAGFGGYTRNGGFAGYVLADADYVAHIPPGLSAVGAAPLICAGITPYEGIKVSQARPGEWPVVSGAGGLGYLAGRCGRAMGLLVCAVNIELQPLSAIDDVMARLADGDVPSRLVPGVFAA